MSNDKQPKRVCVPCGNLYRLRPGTGACITVSMSECEVCGKQTMCAYAYDFGHLRPEWQDHRSEEQAP